MVTFRKPNPLTARAEIRFNMKHEMATFAAGCFWHVQEEFDKTPGVISTVAGYTGGKTPSPNYNEVLTGKTGHAEALLITYDPSKTSYKELLKVFFNLHDPTQLNRQGPDVGTNYRSAIFTHNTGQEKEAKAFVEELIKAGKYKKPIVTQIQPAEKFYPAEEYHQQYFKKHKGLTCDI
ncbi:Peptide methionine sulfoxide reductase MsrA [uncultured archaeon]|nr:Peptide methionine sulfoxide reductase MsrA [uncultured archaeon]